LANLILRGVSFQEIAVAESLRLCASAWEADRADAAAVKRERDILYESQVKLEVAQRRIEALEREIDVGEAEGDIGAHRLHELRAALRGEEERCPSE
jgi:hypothetical protein